MTVETFFSAIAGLSGFLFIVSSMLAMGMSLTMAQILQPLRNVRLVLLALLATISTLNAAPIARPAFETETWAKGRTLIWAKPGISGEIGDPSGWTGSDGRAVTAADCLYACMSTAGRVPV